MIAPQGAAGLGDFEAQARRLERLGICIFPVAHSRFQGEGAAPEIRNALLTAMDAWDASGSPPPDAVVIIRGGGAVNDLAWLNDYDLARCVCELTVPVLTGIGHERDNTVLDEVANIRFDTPSKVIAGIEQVIGKRVAEAKANFETVAKLALRATQATRRNAEQADAAVRAGALRQVAMASEHASQMLVDVRLGASQAVRAASDRSKERFFAVRHASLAQVGSVKQALPAMLTEVRSEARQTIRTARAQAGAEFGVVLDRSARDARRANERVDTVLRELASASRRLVVDVRVGSEALMREIAGQGPEKTLGRGFAVVRNAEGGTLTSATGVPNHAPIEIEFHDGKVAARTAEKRGGKAP